MHFYDDDIEALDDLANGSITADSINPALLKKFGAAGWVVSGLITAKGTSALHARIQRQSGADVGRDDRRTQDQESQASAECGPDEQFDISDDR